MPYRAILYSNSKLLTLYFIGTFITLFVAALVQQHWHKITDSPLFERYFIEEVLSDNDSNNRENISQNGDIPGVLKNEFVLSEGDNLEAIFYEANLSKEDVYKIIESFSKVYSPKKIRAGNTIYIDFAKQKVNNLELANKITIRVSNTQEVQILRTEDGKYHAKLWEIPLVKRNERLTGTISNSFIATATKFSIPYHAVMSMVKAYSYDVDFQRDIRQGNKLDIIVDKFYTKDGKFSHFGGVIYSKLTLTDRNIEIYQFKNKEGDLLYYNADAVSVRKQLLRTPVNAARISSGFGLRKHPVLGYSRMHKGVDFAAPVGTPILAAGDGKITIMGRKGGYGKYIRLEHSDTYSTAYAHMSKYGKGLNVGSKVKQGQVIGYIGLTGITSGPHLHFEVLKFGKQINPNKLKSTPQVKLKGPEYKKFTDFKKYITELLKKKSSELATSS